MEGAMGQIGSSSPWSGRVRAPVRCVDIKIELDYWSRLGS